MKFELAVLALFCNVVFSLKEENFTDNSGVIRSNEKDGKYSNVTVKYNVRVSKGRRVKLSFNAFNVLGSMPDCREDSLEIFVGCKPSQSLGKFCSAGLYNRSKLFDIYSKDECISLVFNTNDDKYVSTGFQAEYWSFDSNKPVSAATSCNQLNVYQEDVGTFFTPLWPQKYSNDFRCTWVTAIPDGYNATVYFMSFRIEQNILCSQQSTSDDYVRISALIGSTNKTVVQRLCFQGVVGKKAISYHIDGASKVYITFVADSDNITDTGFAAGFLSYKSGVSVADLVIKPGSHAPIFVQPSTVFMVTLLVVNFLLLGNDR